MSLTWATILPLKNFCHRVNIEGYKDYRGVPVVGAWRWLDKYDMGLATEIDVKEAEEYR